MQRMNAWSQKRKRLILTFIIGALILLVGMPLFLFFYKSPNCSDEKQNGDEKGIDCGGGCENLCQADNLPILLKGDPQVIQVSTTTFAVVMQAQNPNVSADILGAQYSFKVYDATSTVPLRIIEGSTYVPKDSMFAIFVGPLDFGESIPDRITFNWKEDSLIWNKNSTPIPNLIIENKNLSIVGGEPKLTAEIYNQTLEPVKNIEMTAILKDEAGNTIGVSRTFVEEIYNAERAQIVFTWPAPFISIPTTIDILIRILPNKSFL